MQELFLGIRKCVPNEAKIYLPLDKVLIKERSHSTNNLMALLDFLLGLRTLVNYLDIIASSGTSRREYVNAVKLRGITTYNRYNILETSRNKQLKQVITSLTNRVRTATGFDIYYWIQISTDFTARKHD